MVYYAFDDELRFTYFCCLNNFRVNPTVQHANGADLAAGLGLGTLIRGPPVDLKSQISDRQEGPIVAYNHRKAELQWIAWKQQEEKQLRELGMDEQAIQSLRTYDREQFNRERRYLQRWQEAPETAEGYSPEPAGLFPQTPDKLLDGIENEQLLKVLQAADRLTLEMLLLRMQGYSNREIAHRYGLQEMAVVNRIARLRKKIKNIF